MTTLPERYAYMVWMREFELACLEGVPTHEVHGELHLGIGQEAIAAGIAGVLRADDALVSTHRNHLHAIAKGVDMRAMLAEIFERSTGLCGGFGGHMHLFDPSLKFSATGIVGAGLPVAVGHAYAARLRGSDAVAVAVVATAAAVAAVANAADAAAPPLFAFASSAHALALAASSRANEEGSSTTCASVPSK